jgi:hypothetical protein
MVFLRRLNVLLGIERRRKKVPRTDQQQKSIRNKFGEKLKGKEKRN